MPSDWVHCLFTASIIGVNYESKHCWVNDLMDSPARFLGGKHRILLHDMETLGKLNTCCWWAGFVAALHIDIDNAPRPIKKHLNDITLLLKNKKYEPFKKINGALKKTEPQTKIPINLSAIFRTAFRKVHEKVGIEIFVDDRTAMEELIILQPNTLLGNAWNYVNQFPLKGIFVDDRPCNELPPNEPRTILHPNYIETLSEKTHAGDCLDIDSLKYLFPS